MRWIEQVAGLLLRGRVGDGGSCLVAVLCCLSCSLAARAKVMWVPLAADEFTVNQSAHLAVGVCGQVRRAQQRVDAGACGVEFHGVFVRRSVAAGHSSWHERKP